MLSRLVNRVRQKVPQLNPRVSSGAVILMYHRVAELDSDPWRLSVTPKHFAEQLEILRKHFKPRSLYSLVDDIGTKLPLHQSIVITFDDGYADNLYNAKPLLEKYDIPATVFVTTDGIDRTSEFWWDELDRLLLQSSTLPDSLELTVGSETYQWDLGEAIHYTEAEAHHFRSWSMEGSRDPSPRHSLYRSLYQALQFLSEQQREDVLTQLQIWANVDGTGRDSHRSLTSAELVQLEAGSLVEIGAHTTRHPFLAKLPLGMQQDEIQQSKTTLEQILGHPVQSFSYPNGSFVPETPLLVKEAGFACACSSINGRVQTNADLFLLPRMVVEDWDGEIFEKFVFNTFS